MSKSPDSGTSILSSLRALLGFSSVAHNSRSSTVVNSPSHTKLQPTTSASRPGSVADCRSTSRASSEHLPARTSTIRLGTSKPGADTSPETNDQYIDALLQQVRDTAADTHCSPSMMMRAVKGILPTSPVCTTVSTSRGQRTETEKSE
ncbi:hypothetical protein BCR39DRAFT_561478 [Naematelia encephala]|uniref:Uncharacterized protein n=1 Tax=Naematelia encephala TaxID=71784 RepID=A0A1Y2AQK5_9TREE|nr:hypothetical protein BCR39DRAFT_561478 [Naematelia encephala]